MVDTIEYIESYFQQTLGSEEKETFERRCETDETFAKEVAFYITSRQALKEALLKEKFQSFKEAASKEDSAPIIAITKRSIFSRYITYAAAACLLLVASVYLFETQTSPKKYAANYIKSNYSALSQTMDASHDSLQLGIAAYNNKNYSRALQLFTGVEQNDPQNSDAKKYAGLTYLQQHNYDKAIIEFDALSNMKLFSNPGDFLKAISLLERNATGDKEEAKKLLQKVVENKEEGNEKAQEWLNKL